jgi:hypothetical protein
MKQKLSPAQISALTLLSEEDAELTYEKGAAGWWIGLDKISGVVANVLIRHCLVSMDQYSRVGEFERWTLNETGREALKTGILPQILTEHKQ